ncbi:MAG: RNA-binding protein [Pseudomonadales bacterium]|nr:RNA-binding protein [Pseudomonadales bacterium]NIX06683.1 RNA-binding protein [Pseudomonadales bacterium]
MSDADAARLDRWLWAARFFKTRAQAKAAIEGGRVHLHLNRDENGATVRPKVSKEVSVGDVLTVRRGLIPETVVVRAIAQRRGSATVAAKLYDETPTSIEVREAQRARRQMERLGLKVPSTKPSKRDRRALKKLKEDSSPT